jgi:adenine-specific DNA-methyltransferase
VTTLHSSRQPAAELSAPATRWEPTAEAVGIASDVADNSIIEAAAAWARSGSIAPLPLHAVAGTTDSERQALATLGGLAGALAGSRVNGWPLPLRKWASAPPPPADLVDQIRQRLDADNDLLASIYERLVQGRNRRRLGTFFTPPEIVSFMIDEAAEYLDSPNEVIDPGAGVGAFSIAAKKRWPEARVAAVDVNLVTLGLLAARTDMEVELVLEDFLEWSRTRVSTGSRSRLWIGNPPYTRHHALAKDLKDRAFEISDGLVSSRRAGLSSYFLAATLRARRPRDVICYVLPGSWVDAAYGASLRKAIDESVAGVVKMHGFTADVEVFPGTRVAAMTILIGPDAAGRSQQVVTTSSAEIADGRVHLSDDVQRNRGAGSEPIGQRLWARRSELSATGRVPLRTFAEVHRGVATGANHHFFLTDSDLPSLPERALVPAVVKLRPIDGDVLTRAVHADLGRRGYRRWLLSLNEPELLLDPGVQQWIQAATKASVPDRYLCRTRKDWYRVEVPRPPDILLGPMAKGRMRAVVNEIGAAPSNAIYGLYLGEHVELIAPLAAWLNSAAGQEALVNRARVYGNGLYKLEPSDVASVLVPDEESLRTVRLGVGEPARDAMEGARVQMQHRIRTRKREGHRDGRESAPADH